MEGEKLTMALYQKHLQWSNYLKYLQERKKVLEKIEKERKKEEKEEGKKEEKKEDPLIDNPFNETDASIEEVKKHVASILKVRKDMAVKFEAMVVKEFDELKKLVPEQDLNRYMKFFKKFP